MGARGPVPKDPSERIRRNITTPLATVTPDGVERGPELPDGYEWPSETCRWWQHWREAPQSQTFLDTDWDYLLDTAMLHADFWMGDRSNASELRQRMAKFGATADDRRRLNLVVTEPGGRPDWVSAPSARQTGNRKARLRKVAG
jgi:hypothetical protein